ncbi:hypothetical protein GcLGCM259_2494 [Glutamicibacter creatinolyticus]|uniref:Transposase n=1 Tax=Glutamicibacter creatinolyticus TaxID=162496 RepID=A0A5B7WVX0_9MICC|nr:hypothetical protein GcLGCM259_2494 [Glutamicibacter creatinolyticus]
MTIVAEKYDYVIGIDTHARTHTYAIIDTRTGGRTGCEAFPVSGPGHRLDSTEHHQRSHCRRGRQ